MKKLFVILMIGLLNLSTAFAADPAAKIKIKINGALNNNRYFLCLPDVGCLSMQAAQQGKIYSFFNTLELSQVFVKDITTNKMSQAFSNSCNTTVNTDQVITISGSLVAGKSDTPRINQLRCSVH